MFVANTYYKMQWGLIPLGGLISIVIAVVFWVYAGIVVEHGPFPNTSSGFLVMGAIFFGAGLGWFMLTPAIRSLEKKIKALEQPQPQSAKAA